MAGRLSMGRDARGPLPVRIFLSPCMSIERRRELRAREEVDAGKARGIQPTSVVAARGEADSTEEFLDTSRGGLTALSSAHALLVHSDWKSAEEALARRQREPYVSTSRIRVTVRESLCFCRAFGAGLGDAVQSGLA